MKFFETTYGTIYPTAKIRSIRRGKWNGLSAVGREDGKIQLADVSDLATVTDEEIDRILRAADQVVPAYPGFIVLAGYYNEEDETEPFFVEEMPVVAWRVDEDRQPQPVVADYGFEELTIAHGILRPDGTVIDHHGTTYRVRADWEDGARTWLREAAAREKAQRGSAAIPAPAQ